MLAARAICSSLQRNGHEGLTTTSSDNANDAEAALTEEQVYRRDLEWLTQCEVLVAEASGSTYGVGFEVGYVLGQANRTGQRVLLLYDRNRRHAISRLITGNCDDNCTTFGYASLEELLAMVEQRFAKG